MAIIQDEVSIPLKKCKEFNSIFITFNGLSDNREHIAIKLGCEKFGPGHIPLVRVHSECMTGDLFGSQKCDCGEQLMESLELVSSRGGYIIYMRQEGRGIGLYEKLKAYRIQSEQKVDTYLANNILGYADDLRKYDVASEMLTALNACEIDLLTNNPDKVVQLTLSKIKIRKVIKTGLFTHENNINYILAKTTKTNHTFNLKGTIQQ